MATRREPSAELTTLKERVDQWRKQRRRRTRIPRELWEAAVKVAQIDGLWATARATHFHYPDLKQRLAAARRAHALEVTRTRDDGASVGRPSWGAAERGTFVELSLDPMGRSRPTVVELVGARGDRMRVEAATDLDLVGLARAFFGRDGR